MTHLEKIKTGIYVSSPHTKEAHSKQNIEKYDDIPKYKIGDLIMTKNFDKKSNWDAKYLPSFRIIRLIGTRELEVSDPQADWER